jgi:hypothetical protein
MGLADDLAKLQGRETFANVLDGLTDDERDGFMVALGSGVDATVIAETLLAYGHGGRMGDLPQAIRDYRLRMRREGRI